jgi:hypothetical protein
MVRQHLRFRSYLGICLDRAQRLIYAVNELIYLTDSEVLRIYRCFTGFPASTSVPLPREVLAPNPNRCQERYRYS